VNAEAAQNYAKSIAWNGLTTHLAECISKGVDVNHLVPTVKGWVRVGRYAAGKDSAWVQAAKLKRRWPNLETDVRGVEEQEWKAEVWVKRREGTT